MVLQVRHQLSWFKEMLIERRIEVDHSTIYCWVQYYAPKLLEKLKWHWKPKLELRWRVDCHC